MHEVAKELSAVLDSLGESPHFCVTGAVSPVLPGLAMKGGAAIGLPISTVDARQLIAEASQAPYGRGADTIVDTSVRRVWQLEPKQVSLRNFSWKPFVEGIVENVRIELGIRQKVEYSFYKLLVYEKGSFFARTGTRKRRKECLRRSSSHFRHGMRAERFSSRTMGKPSGWTLAATARSSRFVMLPFTRIASTRFFLCETVTGLA